MKTYFAAALVASTQATITSKDATDMATGYLHGLGLSENVDNCFTGTVPGLEGIVVKLATSDDCSAKRMMSSTACINDLLELSMTIMDGLQQC